MTVDTPKGGLLHGQKELSWPETRQRVTSYAHLHVTLYADTTKWHARRPAPKPLPAPRTPPRTPPRHLVTASAAVSPAAAVHAALAANPGSAVAVIADAAGTGKPAARDALLAMEKGGTATRVKGGKPGIPDTWTLARPAQDNAGPEDEQAASPATAPPAARTVPATTRRSARPARTGLPRPPAPDSKTLTPGTAPTQRAGTAPAPRLTPRWNSPARATTPLPETRTPMARRAMPRTRPSSRRSSSAPARSRPPPTRPSRS